MQYLVSNIQMQYFNFMALLNVTGQYTEKNRKMQALNVTQL